MATKVKAAATVEQPTLVATYGFKGKGKSRVYLAVLPVEVGNPGDRVELHASYGGVNYGTLRTIDEVRVTDDGVNVASWTFDQIKPTAEQFAYNRAKKAEAQATYYTSDKGRETAAKVLARINPPVNATESIAPIGNATETVASATETPTTSVDLSALAIAMKAAGFTATEVLAALQGATPTEVASAVQVPPVVRVPNVITSTRPTPVPRPNITPSTPTTSSAATANNGTKRVPCVCCTKKVDRLFHHAAASGTAKTEINVCNPCMSLDGDTVVMRVKRNVAAAVAVNA